jgi:hypothetical protein
MRESNVESLSTAFHEGLEAGKALQRETGGKPKDSQLRRRTSRGEDMPEAMVEEISARCLRE